MSLLIVAGGTEEILARIHAVGLETYLINGGEVTLGNWQILSCAIPLPARYTEEHSIFLFCRYLALFTFFLCHHAIYQLFMLFASYFMFVMLIIDLSLKNALIAEVDVLWQVFIATDIVHFSSMWLASHPVVA